MSIHHFTLNVPVVLVTCTRCPASTIVPTWQDAASLGWTVPEGRVDAQLCPSCAEEALPADAVTPEPNDIVGDLLLGAQKAARDMKDYSLATKIHQFIVLVTESTDPPAT